MRCQHCGAENVGDARFCGVCGRATSATEPSRVGDGPSAALVAPDLTGREIAGRYRILAKLGEGGMGAVYRGEQISLKRKVAIKLLRPELSADPALVRRFNSEAELVAKLSHPNTVNIFDFGQDGDGTLFIAMEYLEGRSLRQAITAEGPMPAKRALHVLAQVASSLADAHAHGIVHRDLKPDNVMLTARGREQDVVRVLDFGIAKVRDEQKGATVNPMTQAGDLVGTPQYMAPEQIRGEHVDGRTDVYALGAILYEMITGRMPFEGASLMIILSRHLMDPPQPPTQRRPDLPIPPQLDALVLEMLAKDPRQRPQSMDAVSERIGQLAMTLGATTHPQAVPSQGWTGAQPSVPSNPPYPTPGSTTNPGARLISRPPGVPNTMPPGMMMAPPPAAAQPVPLSPPYSAAPVPVPVPVPAPDRGLVPPPQRSKTNVPLLIVGGLVLVAGIGVAVFLAQSDSSRSDTGTGTGTGTGAATQTSPPSPKGLTGDLVDVGAAWQVQMPLGFIFNGADEPGGGRISNYSGTIDGDVVRIMAVSLQEDMTGQPKSEMDDGCNDIGRSMYGGGMVSSSMVSGRGPQVYRCTITGSDSRAVEGALYTAPGTTLAIFFETPAYAFDKLRAARDELFDRRVRAPSGFSP